MDHDDEYRSEGEIFHDFGMACRAERDRIALSRLAAQDRRFDVAFDERARAVSLSDRAIAAAAARR